MAKTFILQDESLNTLGFWIKSEGIDLAQIKKNPVMLFMHIRPGDEGNQGKDMLLPIGRWENIRLEDRKVLADAVFDLKDPFAKRIADKVDAGFINMASIGVTKPWQLSAHKDDIKPGQTRPTVIKCMAKEASIVDMGSNLNALRLYDENEQVITLSEASTCVIPLINQPNKIEMKTVIGYLKLADTANEAEVYQAIVKLSEKLSALEADKLKLEGEKTKLEGDILKLKEGDKTAQAEKILTLVEKAVTDRKILATSKATYIKLAEQDFDSTKAVLDAMPVMSKLTEEKTDVTLADKYKGKTWKELDKIEGALAEIKLKDANHFKELFKAEFGTEPTM